MADKEEKPKPEEKPEGEAAAPAKSKKKLFIIVGAVVGVLLAIGVPTVMFTMKSEEKKVEEVTGEAPKGSDEAVPEGTDDEDELEEGEEAIGALFPFETFVVNLSGGRYVRCQVQLEFVERDIPKRFYSRIVPVRDGIITLLSQRTQEDLSTVNGKDALKSDIKDLINEMIRKQEVKKVYFTQFVIQ